jgi:23S rRNA (guanosine2251-2'-O)-methyltransferase
MPFLIYGINPVSEAVRSRSCRIKEIWVAAGRTPQAIESIINEAHVEKIPLGTRERRQLDALTKNAPHQGVVAFIEHFAYADLDGVLRRNEGDPLLLVLDGMEDPRNLGALIRTAAACGVWGVIIPKDRAAGITPAVVKSSAGAVFHLPVVRVTNIAAVLTEIKERNIWVAGAAADAQTDLYHHDLAVPLAVVIGGEGRGIRPLVRRGCDFLVSIPMHGPIGSLNASVAGAIIMYECLRQRASGPRLPRT